MGLRAWGVVLFFSPVQGMRVHHTSPAPKQAAYGTWPPTTAAVINVLPKRISRIFVSPFCRENIRKELENWPQCFLLLYQYKLRGIIEEAPDVQLCVGRAPPLGIEF